MCIQNANRIHYDHVANPILEPSPSSEKSTCCGLFSTPSLNYFHRYTLYAWVKSQEAW